MKLARQLSVLLLGPIAAGLAVHGVIANQNRYVVVRDEASAELRAHATLVEAAVERAVEHGQLDVLKQRIERLARADRILGIAAFSADGKAILVTNHIAESTPALSALARRAADQREEIEEELTIGELPALMRAVPLAPATDGSPAVAVVVRDLRYLDDFADALNRGLIITGAALLGLTALIAALASRATVGRPSRAIVEGAERVAAGELSTQVPERGVEELERLARAFNKMTTSLAGAQARAEREEGARVEVERRLQHAQALAAIGQVAASIAHEIGSPLNVILGRARRLAQQPSCPESVRGELETIAVQSERISRVMARLLSAARPPRAPGPGSDLGQVVQEAVAFVGPECRRRRIRTRLDQGTTAATVELDADRLFQVVFNLCLNAIQAQPEGGELIVRTRPHNARKVAIEVEDRGPGVPPEAAAHIFDPFFTSKGRRDGTGLGLAIVDGIVREAGGNVELTSAEEGGACFRVNLPVSRPRQSAPGMEVRP